jgi:hypothetical protein
MERSRIEALEGAGGGWPGTPGEEKLRRRGERRRRMRASEPRSLMDIISAGRRQAARGALPGRR